MNVLTLLDIKAWMYTAYYIKQDIFEVPKNCPGEKIDFEMRLTVS